MLEIMPAYCAQAYPAATLYPECQQAMATDAAISEVLREIGVASLKEEQREALLTFLSGRDMFVMCPTEYGKLLIFAVLPLALQDLLNHHH